MKGGGEIQKEIEEEKENKLNFELFHTLETLLLICCCYCCFVVVALRHF